MKTRLMALAAALSVGVAGAALAQTFPVWDRIGSVNISNFPDQDVEHNQFGGRMTRLSFRAANSDVQCRDISATFNNGRTRTLYSGALPFNQQVTIDLPGVERRVEAVHFDCRANAPRGSRVDIMADIGQYRAEWQQSPDWLTVWSRLFNWPTEIVVDRPDRPRPGPYGGWIPLSTERFEGPRDHETTIPGARGRAIETVGIRPLDNDATCMRLSATYQNGRTSDLWVNRGGRLMRNRIYEVDLPGAQRNLARLDMMCRGERGRPVSIEVLGNR
jgi:hypothetical protein